MHFDIFIIYVAFGMNTISMLTNYIPRLLAYNALYGCKLCLFLFLVVGSIVLSSSNYDAFEANGTVSVCAVIMAEAIETTVNVQLSSQDSTARSKNDNTVVSQVSVHGRLSIILEFGLHGHLSGIYSPYTNFV